jgi:hypothetical protein
MEHFVLPFSDFDVWTFRGVAHYENGMCYARTRWEINAMIMLDNYESPGLCANT